MTKRQRRQLDTKGAGYTSLDPATPHSRPGCLCSSPGCVAAWRAAKREQGRIDFAAADTTARGA
jgi:hypothetical protein